jgi:hypothetical protein
MVIKTQFKRTPEKDFSNRKYYLSKNKRIFCQDIDSLFYQCSKDGEPQEQVIVRFYELKNEWYDTQLFYLN